MVGTHVLTTTMTLAHAPHELRRASGIPVPSVLPRQARQMSGFHRYPDRKAPGFGTARFKNSWLTGSHYGIREY